MIWYVYSGSERNWNNIHLSLEKDFFFFPWSTEDMLIVGKYDNDPVAFPSDNTILLGYFNEDKIGGFTRMLKACQTKKITCEDVEDLNNDSQFDIPCIKIMVDGKNEIWGENKLHIYCGVMNGQGIVEYNGDMEAYPAFKEQLISLARQMESQKPTRPQRKRLDRNTASQQEIM